MREAHGVKGETFIITIVSSSLIPPHPRLLKCPVFSTHLSSPSFSLPLRPHHYPPLSVLSPISVLQIPPYSTTPPLPICSSPVSTFPLNGLTLRLENSGEGEKKRGREVETDRERAKEGERQASGCKGECTWMGRLPGHAVRGYCPACQQPLSFNGARISSF